MRRVLFIVACLAGLSAQAQKADTAKKAGAGGSGGPKPYGEVITAEARSERGLFTVDFLKDRYYFEIPDSLMGRDILVVNRISKSAAGDRNQMMGYAGDEIGNNVIRFERGPSNKVFLKVISYGERSKDSSESGMYRSVLNSSVQPIMASFEIKAVNGGGGSAGGAVVIDVTDYLNTENEVFYFQPFAKNALGIGAQQNDRSYISGIRSFPMNVEIKTVKTYSKSAPAAMPGFASLPPSGVPITFELNSSIVLLPVEPMKARYADARVGFFAANYVDFDADRQGVKRLGVITRWRLEPKDEAAYKRGELVEPKKPIVFYIDPATPRRWVPYLIQGVNDWQKAFEQAGFKNAIYALEAPKDSSWSIDDARHNVIVYKPSEIPNASGPHVHDPRSGEIIETHVNWYHNVMRLVHDWYMIQAGAVDERARKMQFDDSLMGQLIRFVSSHEIGHTLGLRHNYGSSSTVPVEKLRDKAWVEAHGHTPSIMDYARFNYVAQPEDHIGQAGLFPRIGDYDRWAIQWGYRWMPEFADAKAEAGAMNRLIIDSIGHNKRLWFGTEQDYYDPRSQNEDLGDDGVLASSYGIKNLQRILPHLLEWTREPNEGYDGAASLYIQLFGQYNQYMAHVAKIIGGSYSTPKAVEEPGLVFEPVPYEKQKAAMAFFKKEVFATPKWLVNEELIGKTNMDIVSYIKGAQDRVLHRILGPEIVYKLVKDEAELPSRHLYTASELMSDLRRDVWTELDTHADIDLYRRNLQKRHVSYLGNLLWTSNIISLTQLGGALFGMVIPAPAQSDVGSLARASLVQLREDIRKALPQARGLSRYHLQDMIARINETLLPVQQVKQAL
ncbi:MAG: zinc-dependent metalloprotease [Bacteroidetes bacterium]|nr:zinc-dependent metalloprotease [Bacteroidota bacterium]